MLGITTRCCVLSTETPGKNTPVAPSSTLFLTGQWQWCRNSKGKDGATGTRSLGSYFQLRCGQHALSLRPAWQLRVLEAALAELVVSLLWFLDQSSRHSGWDSPLTIDGSSSAPGRCDYSGGKGTRQTWLCQTDPTHPREAELWEVMRSRQRSRLAQKKELDKTRGFLLF